jgi:uncharacterized protein (TIGR02266 family)
VISPGTVRVRLRYTDLETFIERFAPNVTRGGIFLASRTPRAEGEVFSFEVQLAGGEVALSGEGKVIWVKPFNAGEPQKPHGMGVQFVRIDPASREILNRMLQAKAGAPPRTAGGAGAGATAGGAPSPSGGGTVPLRSTQGLAALAAGGGGRNGRDRVDTSVDLAAEYGIDEGTLRRIIDRNWTLGLRDDDDLESLLRPDPVEPTTLALALAGLPRLLDPGVRRRTGALRSLEALAAQERAAAASAGGEPAARAQNGQNADHADHDPNEVTAQEGSAPSSEDDPFRS